MTITAVDLLRQQNEVKRLEDEQAKAWSAIATAEWAVEQAKAAHSLARDLAEDARDELEMLESDIANEAAEETGE